MKHGFKRKSSWNKCKSEITTHPKNNNLDYLIDPTFKNINRLFAFSFKNSNNDPTRDSSEKYYLPLVEIKDFNALINNEPFFDQPVKRQTRSVSKTFFHHRKYYKLVGRDLSRLKKYNHCSTD